MGELLDARLPPGIAGDPQPVEMGLDALVMTHQVRQPVMRLVHGAIAKEPEEGGFLSVLGDDKLHSILM